MRKQNRNESGFTVVEAVIILVILAAIGLAGWYVYSKHHKQATMKTTMTSETAPMIPAVQTNTWTGKGSSMDWSNASNWTLGVPKNGQALSIDIGKVTVSSGLNPIASMNDNIPNLSIYSLTFTGQNSVNDNMTLTGNTLTLTNSIINKVANNHVQSGPQISNNIDLNGAVTIDAPQQSSIDFMGTVTVPKSSQATLRSIHLAASDPQAPLPDDMVVFDGALSGSGQITVSPNASVGFETSSPDFSGHTTITHGAVVDLGNQSLSANDISATLSNPDGLGSSNITIQNGGALDIDSQGSLEGANQTAAMDIGNDIAMQGNGIAYSGSNSTGTMSGAITNCLGASDGCSGYLPSQEVPGIITFTGTITLTGNTELGTVTDSLDENPVQYDSTHYVFKHSIVTNNHTLTGIPNSNSEIVKASN